MSFNSARFMVPLLGLVLVSLLVPGCLSGAIARHQRFIDAQVLTNPSIERYDLQTQTFNLHYRGVGHARDALLIWIHGTPGGWSDIGRLMVDTEFTAAVRVVTVDRPGWGGSKYGDRQRALPDFAEQVRLIRPLLIELEAEYPQVPKVLAGHSLGAPLALSVAADSPIDLAGVLALSGPFDPELAEPRWYNRAARTWLVSAVIGSALRRSNVEMYALQDNLRAALPEWRSLQLPLVVVQGESDRLVPYGHFEFARQAFAAPGVHFVSLADQGHLLQIERVPMIANCVLAIAHGTFERCSDDVLHDAGRRNETEPQAGG